MNRDPYQIAIVGSPGRGKTYSFRNMDKETTGFINTEGKPLPFKNEFKFYHKSPNWQDTYSKLIEYAKNKEIKTIVLESFSAYVDYVLKNARDIKKGFDIWSMYNQEIGNLMSLLKMYPKDIIITAHSELVESDEGIAEKRISVQGKQWKGMVEKEFTIVLFSGVKLDENNKRNYYFELNSDGKTSAKTPPMFFPDQTVVPNDSQLIIKELERVLGT
jgi:hypothetical protein